MITKQDITLLKQEQEKVLSYSVKGIYVDNRKDNDLINSIKRTIKTLKARNKYIQETETENNITILKEALEDLK